MYPVKLSYLLMMLIQLWVLNYQKLFNDFQRARVKYFNKITSNILLRLESPIKPSK